MAIKITDNEIGKIYEIWNTTPLGKHVQESQLFESSTAWWTFLKSNPHVYLSEFGFFEIKPQGKDLAVVLISPFYGEPLYGSVYNEVLDDAIKTAWGQGFKQVLGTVQRQELEIFVAPEEPRKEELKKEETEPNGELHDDKRMAESDNSKPTANKQPRKKNKQPAAV